MALPRSGGMESLRISLRIPATWPGWLVGCYGGVGFVTGPLLRARGPGHSRRLSGRRPGRKARRPAVRRLGQTRNGIISRATMFATLIIGLIAGPAVSL